MRLELLRKSRYGPPLLVSAVLLTISALAWLLFVSGRGLSESVAGNPPQVVPDLRFTAADGKTMSLSSFRGRAVLLNIWATWCAPCRKEMPALDRLERKIGGPEFQVLALSMDGGGLDRIQAFYAQIGIKSLRIYLDRNSAATTSLGIIGLPTTLLIGAEGAEIQRWVGPAEWDSPEIVQLIQRRPGALGDRRTEALHSPPANVRGQS